MDKKQVERKVVETKWIVEHEFMFHTKCPYCKRYLSSFNFSNIDEDGQKVNKVVKCPYCNSKFKVKVPESEF